MNRMFGDRIYEFVLANDIINRETFEELLDLIRSYVQTHLNVTYFSVLEEGTVDGRQGLQTRWSTREQMRAYTIDVDREYASHSAYAFGENKPIWVVSASRQILQEANDYKDMWSESTDLPRYSPTSVEKVRTSVMHPIRRRNRPIGVVEFAAERFVEPTPASLEEVKTLAMVISRTYQLYETRRTQLEDTRRALDRLEDALRVESWKRLALPQLFIAYSGSDRLSPEARDEHEAVIAVIRNVVDDFSSILEPIYWSDVTDAGNINAQVIRSISMSEFGICYFSEPIDPEGYKDNSNVLFEAGMMQALTNSHGALLRGWIPIREKESPDIPFDIAAERILMVNRSSDGLLDEDKFTDALRLRLQNLLKDIDGDDNR